MSPVPGSNKLHDVRSCDTGGPQADDDATRERVQASHAGHGCQNGKEPQPLEPYHSFWTLARGSIAQPYRFNSPSCRLQLLQLSVCNPDGANRHDGFAFVLNAIHTRQYLTSYTAPAPPKIQCWRDGCQQKTFSFTREDVATLNFVFGERGPEN